MRGRRGPLLSLAVLAVGAVLATPAAADHGNPTPVPPVPTGGQVGRTTGPGTWTHIAQFAGSTGTDVKFINKGGVLYASGG